MPGMDIPPRDIKNLVFADEVRQGTLEGARKMSEAVGSTYGPGGWNVGIKSPFGFPVVTRDGVTVAKRIAGTNMGFESQLETMAAEIIYQASDQTNKNAGDGTTATVVLAYNLLSAAMQRLAATEGRYRGQEAWRIKRELEASSRAVVAYLKSQSKAAKGHLLEVATVSSGDAGIGQLVSDTLEDIGPAGGITIREQAYPTLDVERVNGYYFPKGCFYLNQQVEYDKPYILVSQKRLNSNTDILPILNFVHESNNKKLVIIGDVSGDALATTIQNVVKGVLEAIIVPPPMYGDEARLFYEDIATYVGSTVLTDADTPDSINEHYFGGATRVQATSERAIIFGGSGGEAIATRASELKRQIDKEPNAHRKSQLEDRYTKLVGKIAIVNVGGSTPSEMEELRYRVEDAIEAVKSAMTDGIVPGGATMLVRAAAQEEVKGTKGIYTESTNLISPMFKTALEATFKRLFDNAGEPADYRLKQIQNSKPGYGFNLREMNEEPIDLAKAGIWDATKAVTQTVENATSAAVAILRIGTFVGDNADERSGLTA
jgi:chaperonin GroEL